MITTPSSLWTSLVTVLVASSLTACEQLDDVPCGFGTAAVDDECASISTCGPGTSLVDGQCLSGQGGSCGAGTELSDDGTSCVLVESACPAPNELDAETGQCTSADAISCGPGTTLIGSVCVPSCEGEFEVPNSQRTGCEPAARLQFVHASPDPTLTSIDLYIGGVLAETDSGAVGDDLAYRAATGFLKVSPGARIRVAPASSTSSAQFVAEVAGGELTALRRYLVVLRGVTSPGFDDSVNDISLTLDAVSGVLEESDDGPSVAVYHAVADADSLSVDRRGPPSDYQTATLASSIAYGTLSGYDRVPNPAALDVLENSESVRSFLTTATTAEPPLDLTLNSAAVVVFTGVVDPAQNRGPSGNLNTTLDAVWVDPTRGGLALDPAPRAQILHAAEAPSVTSEISTGSGSTASLTAAIPFESTSVRVGLIAGVQQTLTVVDGSTMIASAQFNPEIAEPLRFVLIGDQARTDDRSPALVVIDDPSDASERAQDTLVLNFVHGAVDAAGRLDVHLSRVNAVSLESPEFLDLGYGEAAAETPAVSRLPSTVSLTPAGSSAFSFAQFDIDLSSTAIDSAGATLVLLGDTSQPETLELLIFGRAGVATQITGTSP